jgi:hypothetical protein
MRGATAMPAVAAAVALKKLRRENSSFFGYDMVMGFNLYINDCRRTDHQAGFCNMLVNNFMLKLRKYCEKRMTLVV